MPAPRTSRRARFAALVSVVLAISGLQMFLAPQAAQASVSATIASFPYTQDWFSPGLITVTDDWSGVSGVQGYRGDDGTTTTAGIDPQTILADRSEVTNVAANNSSNLNTNTAGGILEHEPSQAIVMQGSGTADAPHLVFHLDLSGKSQTQFSFDAKDLDGGTDNTNQQVAVQYRIGSTGAYTNLPAGYIADATTGPSLATLVTHKDVPLPVATDNAADVYVRVMTTNAASNDEWVGIDNISITSATGPAPLSLATITAKTGTVDTPITGFSFSAAGGTPPYTYSAVGLPDGVEVAPSTGAVSGTPTTACTCAVTAKVTDADGTEVTRPFTFTVSSLSVTNPGSKLFTVDDPITPFTINVNGGSEPFSFAVSAGSLPLGLALDDATGVVSGTPTTPQAATSVTITVTDANSDTASTTFTIAVNSVLAIATLQGTGARSTYAGSGAAQGTETVTTKGVITALYTKGFASSGAPSCGLCGFYLQTGGTGAGADQTLGSDGIFAYGTPGFTGLDSTGAALAVGQSVKVTGKISEFAVSGDTLGTLTELNFSGASSVVPIAALTPPTPLTALPALADREAHEGEIVSPTDLVITDVYNFETSGELGLATGGKPLVQPTEICADDDTGCIAAARADIKNRGWFLDDGSTTAYLTAQNFYTPQTSANSDIPLPFMDATHSARVGAKVTFPAGKPGVIGYGGKKWYVYPQRAVQSTPEGTPDLGADVVTIEDTRPANAAPAAIGGDLKIATYNVENYFSRTGQAFAAANPYFTCRANNDRQGNPLQVDECTSPQAIPNAWDSVTGAPTGYSSGAVSAPRGAWRQADLDRQTSKVVTAINGLGADVVSLEELGNPNKLRTGVTNGPLNPDTSKADSGLGTPVAWRDESIDYLVNALNADAGAGTWAFVASPEESTDATSVAGLCATVQPNGQPVAGPAQTRGTCSWASGQDVIRSGFLYKKETVVPVGPSDLDLPGSSAPTPSPFDNAREPLAQFFKPVGHPNSDGFAVIVNHFKSKGDSDPDATGGNANSDLTGAFNLARTQQATELVRFANEFADKWDTTKVFLVGDFNSYTKEDPIEAIVNPAPGTDDLDFDVVTSDDPDDLTYVFTATVDTVGYGGAGSLDHVLASADARAAISGTDVWEINSNEAGVYNYGRFNTNATNFFDATTPFAGSDHNPEIIGINVGGTPSVKDIQIIGSNDFHGRMLGSTSDGGAAALAGAVESMKATWGADNSVFAAAGDLIGASTFESFVQQDKPTLEALSAAGLEVSAVGNHEFDQGYDDLLNRVMKPYDATTNPYGAEGGLSWEYIGSNVVWETDPDGAGGVAVGDPIVLPTWTKDFGDGIKIGFVGAVTEDLMALVNPAKMQGVGVTPIAEAVNDYATGLKTGPDGVDLVVLLVHEGAPSTSCSTMDDGDSAFAELLGDINPDIDAVISGHTHLEYSCSFEVPEWAADSKPITQRPVVSAGQYGVALDQLVYSFDTATGEPIDVVANNVGVKGPGSTLFSFPEDPEVKAIVDAAVLAAEVPGARVLGQIDAAFKRARLADTTTENRGGESTLGNLVAEIQRWATPETAGINGAQIGFMNPGGLRDDLNGLGTAYPRNVSYKSAAAVQPFANTLVNVDLTGAQIKQVLEQQWQRDAQGNVPSRPFLRLGTSAGFTYTYRETDDAAHPGAKVGTVTGMWLDGQPILAGTSYSVTMNSFLASGGDNFRAFADGVDKRDTGITDLQAQVDYMAANAEDAPLEVDYGQHAVRVTFPGGAPADYAPGATVSFTVGSLAMTAPGDKQDATVTVMLDGQQLGSPVPVTNAASSQPNDEAGTASVSVTLPAGVTEGAKQLHLVGATTGTDVIVPITVSDGLPDTTVSADDLSVELGQDAEVEVAVTPATAGGTVSVLDGSTLLGTATVADGAATVTIDAEDLPALGAHELTLAYPGEAGAYSPSSGTFTLTVQKATPTVVASNTSVVYGQQASVSVTVSATGPAPDGTVMVKDGATVLGSAPVVSGSATVTIAAAALAVGPHLLTADYSGDDSVAPGSDGFTLTVTKAAPTVSAADVTVPVGQTGTASVTVTATGVTPSGSVTLKNGATTIGTGELTSGAASVALPQLPYGTVVSVLYEGDDNVASGSTTFTVLKGAKASATVSATGGTVAFGSTKVVPVTVSTTAAGVTPSGTVTLKEGSTTLGTGSLTPGAPSTVSITLPAASLAVGSHTLSVGYSGDDNLDGTATTVAITVTKAVSTVTAPDVSVGVGQAGTASVTVTANGVVPTGTVTLRNGTTTIGTGVLSSTGQAQVALPVLPYGTVVTVDYPGDTNVVAGSDTFTVLKGAKATATVTAPSGSVEYGAARTVSVQVAAPGAVPTGTVVVRNGATTLGTASVVSGVATITLPARSLPVGAHTLSVDYSGDADVNGAATTLSVTVTKASSTTEVKVQPKNPKPRTKVRLKISVDGANGVPATGQVIVTIDGEKYKANLKKGKAEVELGRFPKGTYQAKVVYQGDANLEDSQEKVRIKVG